jgi:hypothetical protein
MLPPGKMKATPGKTKVTPGKTKLTPVKSTLILRRRKLTLAENRLTFTESMRTLAESGLTLAKAVLTLDRNGPTSRWTVVTSSDHWFVLLRASTTFRETGLTPFELVPALLRSTPPTRSRVRDGRRAKLAIAAHMEPLLHQ